MTKTLEIVEGDVDEFVPCDHCGHRSYYFILLESGSELSYCRHFWLKVQDKIWEKAKSVVDMSHLI